MAGVQRTRIGYGNEGRTKQLAASLSDFIRLFTISLPPTTPRTKSLVMASARGGSPTGHGTPLSCHGAHRLSGAEDFFTECLCSLHHSGLYHPTSLSSERVFSRLSRDPGSLLQRTLSLGNFSFFSSCRVHLRLNKKRCLQSLGCFGLSKFPLRGNTRSLTRTESVRRQKFLTVTIKCYQAGLCLL